MFPIAGPGATPDNKFTEGDPIAGLPATVVTAKFMNDVQAELLAVLGGTSPPIAPSTASQTQVLTAINQLIAAAVTAAVGLPRGYLSGLTYANNVASPSFTIDVLPGKARSSSDTVDISLTALTRGILQSSGAWAAGDNQNKLDSGARAANTWYYLYSIRKTSDGTGDIIFSASAGGPTMPPGFAGFRLIGAARTLADGTFKPFLMSEIAGRRRVEWVTPDMSTSGDVLGTTAKLYTLLVPPATPVMADLNTYAYANNALVYFSPADTADLLPANSSLFTGFTCGYGVVTDAMSDSGGLQLRLRTNSSGQIRGRANTASVTVSILTLGWEQ